MFHDASIVYYGSKGNGTTHANNRTESKVYSVL